jgi:ribosomal protein S18 acetylase RimI-like enzyme
MDVKMEGNFREYKINDYILCEELVNQAWRFDKIFSSKALSDIAKLIYTKGSVLGSNYRSVVEVDGKVIGFIFGLNEYAKKPGRNILFGLSVLWKLIRAKSDKTEKNDLINALKIHEKNRNIIVDRGRSEIVLFVVHSEYHGNGFGKNLWAGFKEYCIKSNISSIIVETNKLGASSFYEHIGFKHLGNFNSPLHEFATKNGQACIYEYSC